MWNEAAIEDAIRKYLATKDEVKLLGCDIRCYYDQHERAEENAILIKAYSTENMNYGFRVGDQFGKPILLCRS